MYLEGHYLYFSKIKKKEIPTKKEGKYWENIRNTG